MRYQSALTVITACVLLSACAQHAFNPSKPEEYIKHWCEPNNIKNSLAYNLATHHNQSNTQLISQQSCRQAYEDRINSEQPRQ